MMKIRRINNELEIKREEDTVLCWDILTACAKGHQTLFKEARKIADEQGRRLRYDLSESPKLAFVRYPARVDVAFESSGNRLLT